MGSFLEHVYQPMYRYQSFSLQIRWALLSKHRYKTFIRQRINICSDTTINTAYANVGALLADKKI